MVVYVRLASGNTCIGWQRNLSEKLGLGRLLKIVLNGDVTIRKIVAPLFSNLCLGIANCNIVIRFQNAIQTNIMYV